MIDRKSKESIVVCGIEKRLTMSINDKSIPLPMYNGNEEEYLVWKSRMEGFATSKGIWIAVVQKAELPTKEADVLDANDAAEAIKIKVKQANGLLMAYLISQTPRWL